MHKQEAFVGAEHWPGQDAENAGAWDSARDKVDEDADVRNENEHKIGLCILLDYIIYRSNVIAGLRDSQ